jgi:TATA-box binding protein (TBP) (component of TFIID and TFIIIB)
MPKILKLNKIQPNFEDIDASTNTIIGITNWSVDVSKIYERIPITEYILVPKKRGRKKKEPENDPNKDIKCGSVIKVGYKGFIRGVDLKKTKLFETFRNSITVIMKIETKFINFKLSQNGKFQITGCKTQLHAEMCVKYMWNYMNEIDQVYTIKKGENPYVIFNTVMTNIDFNLGFLVNRENLDKYINKHTDYNSLLETSFGYTGVNIKIPLKIPENLKLKKLILNDNKDWIEGEIFYKDYVNSLEKVDKNKEKVKKRWNTFLVFQSGNVIYSCMNKDCFMKETYEEFLSIVKDCRMFIEEKITF